MKNSRAIWFLPVILGILIITIYSACSQAPSSPTVATPATLSVDESFNGKEIKLNSGDFLQVSLNSNHTTGFRWELSRISNTAVLEKISDTYETSSSNTKEGQPPLVGAGGKEIWKYKALQKGRCEISMEYSRPWEGGEKGVQKFNLTLNIE